MLERVDIQAFDGPANLVQAPFGSGDSGERTASEKMTQAVSEVLRSAFGLALK